MASIISFTEIIIGTIIVAIICSTVGFTLIILFSQLPKTITGIIDDVVNNVLRRMGPVNSLRAVVYIAIEKRYTVFNEKLTVTKSQMLGVICGHFLSTYNKKRNRPVK